MSTIEKIYREDLKEKKATARSSYNKRTGSQTRKCSLPSDHLTAAQLRKLNGNVVTYNCKTMTREEFEQAPASIQKIALQYHPEFKQ